MLNFKNRNHIKNFTLNKSVQIIHLILLIVKNRKLFVNEEL